MEIRIRELRRVNEGTLRALVDIELQGLIVRGLKVIESEKGKWVAWPSQAWTGRNGERHFSPMVEPATASLRELVSQAILSAFN